MQPGSFRLLGLAFNQASEIPQFMVVLGTDACEPVQQAADIRRGQLEEPGDRGDWYFVVGKYLLCRVGVGQEFGDVLFHVAIPFVRGQPQKKADPVKTATQSPVRLLSYWVDLEVVVVESVLTFRTGATALTRS
jgi:hypothetical protein